ncbi:response regulator transcription factor [Rickettsiales endosymbiont of Peranema trichophorum]|uniref:response regulator transcription factor n=1 Tax=Rickettsiales endosymbiont of Peranema trichophorum TaxID=2486577 RepID=UPI001023EC42|nr:response regulator transcription factor [Rickettsiales endosymbiont of Peranema trichophorum]RZI45629.1 response regulator transcription factor [Rickettsiales endosymbiont of Peranema trichophorum]
MLTHILIVDDTEAIRELTAAFLRNHGYVVSTAASIKECEWYLTQCVFDIIILDIMMPHESGLSFLRRATPKINTPIILLTALGNVDDRICGLESGADDYLEKPFEPKELVLRIKNVLKRHADKHHLNECHFGQFVFYMREGCLYRNNIPVQLTSTEVQLLKILSKKSGNTVYRNEFHIHFPNVTDRSIDVTVARLRKKLEKARSIPEFLQTVRSKGYILRGVLK